MALDETMRCCNRSSGSTCIGCPSTRTEDFDWSVVTWSLRLNVYYATGMPVIESIIFCPISFARHTSTSPVTLTPVTMFLRDVLSANGFLSDIVRSRAWVSFMSRCCRDLLLVLFIGAVLGSTQFLHCSIYLSACRHSKYPRETLLFGISSASCPTSTCFHAAHKHLFYHQISWQAGPRAVTSSGDVYPSYKVLV